jgi:hypothetical protein
MSVVFGPICYGNPGIQTYSSGSDLLVTSVIQGRKEFIKAGFVQDD